MNHTKLFVTALYLAAAGLLPYGARAASSCVPPVPGEICENFTSTTTSQSWTFINGACLTAGTAASDTPASPACGGLPGFGAAYYLGSPLPEFGGTTGTLPDADKTGALRFTDWYAQTGAIVSDFTYPLTSNGLQVSFTTVTYEGNSGGGGGDGADGMSFFLQDATYPADVGAFGGSLGYTCSNVNNDTTHIRANGKPRGYDGLQGGYVGLGIDEYGNFLNHPDNTATGDPATTGWGEYQWGRIGMRGPGSTTASWLQANYPIYYPATLSNATLAAAVQNSCRTGFVWDYSIPGNPVQTPIALTVGSQNAPADYAAIPGAWSVLPATHPIANEAATIRAQAIPITYNLNITTTGLLSLSYSYNGGALQNVITAQDITAGGSVPIPTNVRFGFAGSTGGSRNIHEIMCFQATPANSSQSSAGINQKQTAKVQTGSQVYFAYYNPTTLAGSLTSQSLVGDMISPNDLFISPTVNWDASVVLTGASVPGQTCTSTWPTPPQCPGSRIILTWDGGSGVPFEWGNLSAGEQAALDAGDGTNWPLPPAVDSRLNYLRGDRSNEQTATSSTTMVGTFRARTSVLGDIIDSSPTWVGPPTASLPNAWVDKYDTVGDPLTENSGQSYAQYVSAMQMRTNVVYAGANDGLLHGFRTGYFSGPISTPNTYQAANNDGYEVFAYMPGYIVNSIQTAASAPSNYSDPQYGHHFDVDAPPGTGDLFYGGQWHTWLVGGLGPGGNAIYALDVSNPGQSGNITVMEGSASSVVIGEWSIQGGVTNLSCVNDTSTPCGNNLGKTFGVPQIRRFHNGSWGAVFGNGSKSLNGDGGIYVMLVDPASSPTSPVISFYYLSTSTGSTANYNGIFYTAAADLDNDHITDYVYAGDLQGNIWRFDLTSTNPGNWGVTNAAGVSINAGGGGTPTPLFTTPAGQPITTQVVVTEVAGTVNPRVMVEFGTGQLTPFTNFAAAKYSTSQQALYGIWDWNLATWNSKATVQYAILPNGGATVPASPLSGTSNLLQQQIGGPYTATVAGTGTDYRTLTSTPVCWADTTGCSQYGWYIPLVLGNANYQDPADPLTPLNGSSPVPAVYEQVTYNPTYNDGAFLVNTTIPPAAAAIMCYSAGASGWTMAINPASGGAFTNSFFGDTSHHFLNVTTTNGDQPVSGIAVGGTGTVSVVVQGTQPYIVTQTVSGAGFIDSINPPGGTIGTRLTWTEKR